MALSFQEEVSDGVRTLYSLSFDYLAQGDVYVYAGGHGEYASQLSYRWADSNTIELTDLVQVPDGTTFYIRRIMARTDLIHKFSNKSIRAGLIDQENYHALYLLQEFVDGFTNLDGVLTTLGNLDMLGNSINNMAYAVAASDAVPFQQMLDYLTEVDFQGVIPLLQPRQQGDGTTVTFDTPATQQYLAESFFINIDAAGQRPYTDFTVNNDGTVTFDEAPPSGADIDITLFQPANVGDLSGAKVTPTGLTTLVTLGDKFRELVSVKDFGAVGDGTTDDTVAITTALNSGVAGILFPEGTYIVDGTISVTSVTGLNMFGVQAVIQQTGSRTTNTLLLNGCTDVTIQGMHFKGTGIPLVDGDSGTTGQGIYIYNCQHIRVVDNEISDQSGSGVLANLSSNVWIQNNYVHNSLRLWDIAFGYASPPDNSPMENVWITNNRCYSPNGAWGVHVQGYGRNVNIRGNHTQGHNDYGILVYRRDDFGNRQWQDVIVADNLVEDVTDSQFSGYFAGMGIYLQTITDVTVTGNIVRNVLQGRTDAASPNRTLPPGAISINSVTEVTCTGNTVEDSGIDGIDIVNVDTGTKGNVVANNTVSNCYRNGIYANATQKLVIASNVIDGTVDNLDAGISVSSHATNPTEDVVIDGNIVTQGFYYGVTVSAGTGSGCSRVNVVNNLVRDVIGDYISYTTSGQGVISNNNLHQVVIEHTTGRYGIICSGGDDVVISGNMLKGGAAQLKRGLAVVNTTSPLVTNNLIQGTSDIFYALYMSGNTDQHLFGNVNPRQALPMFSAHSVGENPSTDTGYTVTYGTSAPATGVRGSIHWNLAPSAGGYVGWSCVAPNTWKGFGLIEV